MGRQTILSNFVNGIYCKQQLLDRSPVSFYNSIALQDEPLDLETNSLIALIGVQDGWPILEEHYRFDPGISEALLTIMRRELTRFVCLTVTAYIMREQSEMLAYLPALPHGLISMHGPCPSAESQLGLADNIWRNVKTELKMIHNCRRRVRRGCPIE